MKTEAEKVIEQILGRGIEWYNYRDNRNLWPAYFAEAQSILNSEVFNNEINNYIADLMKHLGYETKDFDQVMHIRTAIVTLETLKERFKSIEDPNVKTSNKDKYESI